MSPELEFETEKFPDISLLDKTSECQKMLDEFNKSNCKEEESPPGGKKMMVYLRIRPLSASEIAKGESKDCISVDSKFSLKVIAPPGSNSYRNTPNKIVTNEFSFSNIFDETFSQKCFFDGCVRETVEEFANSANDALVFTYGITNSGKTYTIQGFLTLRGSRKDPGILPRSLYALFNGISGNQIKEVEHKPAMFRSVKRLTLNELAKGLEVKKRILNQSEISLNRTSVDIDLVSEDKTFDISDDSLMTSYTSDGDMSAIDIHQVTNYSYSVWVSFLEIYNENIFDVLEPLKQDKSNLIKPKRKNLLLREDKLGNPYVKDVNMIQVDNAAEAYKLLIIGRQNLQFACTKLNQRSSRRLSFCDLAGAERAAKTEALQDRLKEAGNINTSLLALSRCMKHLRYNQNNNKDSRVVPFRESKLTRMFQSYFCGEGRVSMVVNASPCASVFDETLHVLRYSSIAKKVMILEDPLRKRKYEQMGGGDRKYRDVPVKKSKSRLNTTASQESLYDEKSSEVSRAFIRLQSVNTIDISEDEEKESEEEDETRVDHNDESLRIEQGYCDIIEQLKQELFQLKRAYQRLEYELRLKIVTDIEGSVKLRIKEIVEMHEKQVEMMKSVFQRRLEIINNELNRVRAENESEFDTESEIDTPSKSTPKSLHRGTLLITPNQVVNLDYERRMQIVLDDKLSLQDRFDQEVNKVKSLTDDLTEANLSAESANLKIESLNKKIDENTNQKIEKDTILNLENKNTDLSSRLLDINEKLQQAEFTNAENSIDHEQQLNMLTEKYEEKLKTLEINEENLQKEIINMKMENESDKESQNKKTKSSQSKKTKKRKKNSDQDEIEDNDDNKDDNKDVADDHIKEENQSPVKRTRTKVKKEDIQVTPMRNLRSRNKK